MARPNSESGMVLVAALLLLAMLSILAVAGIATSTLEVKISAHDRNAKQSFYLCEAGIERAKFQAVSGWGRGTVTPNSPGDYRFDFEAATMPNPGSWEANKWVNFTLADSRGVGCTIQANATDSITQCTGPDALSDGSARIYYGNTGIAIAGGFGVPGPGSMSAIAMGVLGPTTNAWAGLVLVDGNGNPFEITGNDAQSFTLNGGTPTTSNFRVLRAVGVSATAFRLYAIPGGAVVGGPNQDWIDNDWDFEPNAWFLRDSARQQYRVTDTSFGANAAGTGYMELTLASSGATPGHGDFQVVSSPWLATTALAVYDTTNDFKAPSQINYGKARVTVVPSGGRGGYLIQSRSQDTPVADAQTLLIDAEVTATGRVQFSNWRQQVQ